MYDIESARVARGQLSLFDCPTVAEVVLRHGTRLDVAQRLFYDGFLSFDPEPSRRLQPAAEAELDFLCGLASLVGTRHLKDLLAPLESPYAYRLELVTFDFRARRWQLRPTVDLGPAAELELVS